MQTALAPAQAPAAPSNGQLRLRKALPQTALLGLGELELLKREKVQHSGGRIDFLMADPDGDTRYEIEVMLGAVDESHIIRTIEYWDVERQRYPILEHRT